MITPRRIGLAMALVYLAAAVYVVNDDRKHAGFLSNMGTFLLTAPVSFPLSWLGHEPDVRSLSIVVALVAANMALIYFAVAGLARDVLAGCPPLVSASIFARSMSSL